jgi:hypothetical protein
MSASSAEQYGDYPALMAQIEVDLVGGRRLVVATDPSWRAHPGPLVADDLLMGESCDARYEPTGWDRPGFRDDDWRPVIVRAAPGGRLVAQRDPGVRIVDELEPRSITTVEPGRDIVDIGQNIAGHLRIEAAAAAGTTMVIRHAEALDPEGGLYSANLRTARQTDSYTFRSDGPEVFEPRFTTHGFRYAEISGLSAPLDPGQLTARVVSSMGPATGSFACSDELVNAIHRNVIWGLRSGTSGSAGRPTPRRSHRARCFSATRRPSSRSGFSMCPTPSCPLALTPMSHRGSGSPAPAMRAGRTRGCRSRGSSTSGPGTPL